MNIDQRKIVAVQKLEEVLKVITVIVNTDENEDTRIIWEGIMTYIYRFLFESPFKNEI